MKQVTDVIDGGVGGVPRYKVVEVSPVDDGILEACMNEWIPRGFAFEQLHFVTHESSRRPTMAFLFFVERASTRRSKRVKRP